MVTKFTVLTMVMMLNCAHHGNNDDDDDDDDIRVDNHDIVMMSISHQCHYKTFRYTHMSQCAVNSTCNQSPALQPCSATSVVTDHLQQMLLPHQLQPSPSSHAV